MSTNLGAPPELLDEKRLAELTHHQETSKRQVFLMFTENALECLCAMEKACANDDSELWMMATGELSSLANIIGANRFANTVSQVKETNSQLISERKRTILTAREEFERLRSRFRASE